MRRQTEARRRDRYHPPPLHLILIQLEDDGRQNITSRWSSHSPMGIDLTGPGRCPFWAVKTGKAQCEQMFSALPPKADVAQRGRHVRFVQPAQPVDATQALNLSAGVSNCKVSRGRSLS